MATRVFITWDGVCMGGFERLPSRSIPRRRLPSRSISKHTFNVNFVKTESVQSL